MKVSSSATLRGMDYAVLRAHLTEKRPDLDLKAVDSAYEFAKRYHEGQTRYSGEPYITHPVAATEILLRLNPDLAAVQACLLHDVTEDTEATYEDVKGAFGEEVANLVEGLEKLAVVKAKAKDAQMEKWRKMFLAMASDVRIIFIKLADRLHNMRTLQHVPEHKRARIAQESLEVHAAIASRLGIYEFKNELQDLAFEILHPEEYKKIAQKVETYHLDSEACMAFATSEVSQLLFREGIEVDEVTGRFKHLWSLYKKMQSKDFDDFNRIYDLFALRIILPDRIREDQEQVSHLYSVLGLLHHEYLPLQDRFKDYVAVPKPNGYRSLHTTVLGLGGDLYEEPTEIQIRTLQMHREAELGVASHWRYKEGQSSRAFDQKRHKALHLALEKVQAIVTRKPELEGMIGIWLEDYQNQAPEDRNKIEQVLLNEGLNETDLLDIRKGRSQESLRLKPALDRQLLWLRGLAEEDSLDSALQLYSDKIFVLTPQRDVLELPAKATPIDFAYAIHTELGHQLTLAKVNGRVVPLEHELKNGDLVSLVTQKGGQPSRYWLSLAKTSSARAKIKAWFNKQDHDRFVAQGRQALNEQLKLMGEPLLNDKLSLLKDYDKGGLSATEREQVLEKLGSGSLSMSAVLRSLFQNHESLKWAEPRQKPSKAKSSAGQLSSKVLVTGEDQLPVVLSACCKPKQGVAIIGYVTRGRSIRVHRQNCQELSGLEGRRFISVHWANPDSL